MNHESSIGRNLTNFKKTTKGKVMSNPQAEIFVGLECNAKCGFCVQECTIRPKDRFSVEKVIHALQYLRTYQNVHRMIITGGEPTLPKYARRTLNLLEALQSQKWDWELVALYTNGTGLLQTLCGGHVQLEAFAVAGLVDLNLSRHHPSHQENLAIFGVDVPQTEDVADMVQSLNMRLRLNCVLMKGWTDSVDRIFEYLDWAIGMGASSVYFRNLFRIVQSGLYNPVEHDTRDVVGFTQEHIVNFDQLAAGIVESQFVSEVSLRSKNDGQGDELCAMYKGSFPFFISNLRVGDETPGKGIYWAVLPDGHLYDIFTNEVGLIKLS